MAFPRALARDDGLGGTLSFTSKYGSLVASAYDLTTVDGLSERGLAADQLSLAESTHDGLPAPRLRFGEPRTMALPVCLCRC